MIITPIKTEAVTVGKYSLAQFLDRYLTEIKEHDIVVITSKVVSICEGRIVSHDQTNLDTLIESEADYFLPRTLNPYGFGISIKNDTLVSNAGIDESNANGDFVLWPKDPQGTSNEVREYLCNRFHIKEVGVIVSDSHVLPLRWGSVGTVIGFSGFMPLKNYVGQKDIFGREFKVTRGGIAESLAAAAVVVMGEGAECTPLALISDTPFVTFLDRNPTDSELHELTISMDEDIFSPLLRSVEWKTKK